MEEGETSSEDISQTRTVEAAKIKDMTFDDLNDKAWKISQESLSKWKDRLESRVAEQTPAINQHLEDLSKLYGIKAPENVVVNLQYYPQEGSHKGEPINNFVETGRLEEDFADVIYWVPNPSSLPEEVTDEVLQKIMHETQHISFGGEKFQDLVKTAEQNPKVIESLKKLEGVSGNYMEVTTELVVTYIENMYDRKTTEDTHKETFEGIIPVTIEIDKDKHGKVLEAIIREDVEGWRDKGKGPGPYTNLRQHWEKLLGGLPNGYETRENEANVTKKDSDKSFKGTRIYEIAGELDTSLAERYVEEGKEIDEDFIVELYKMVDTHISEDKMRP